jgi:hypothetical protein
VQLDGGLFAQAPVAPGRGALVRAGGELGRALEDRLGHHAGAAAPGLRRTQQGGRVVAEQLGTRPRQFTRAAAALRLVAVGADVGKAAVRQHMAAQFLQR